MLSGSSCRSRSTTIRGYDEHGAFKTDEKFSRAAIKHINGYVLSTARVVPQAYIEGTVKYPIINVCILSPNPGVVYLRLRFRVLKERMAR